MVKKYFKKIIAQSPQDLQVISACCEGGKIKIEEIKYLPKNKIFLFLIERNAREKENPKEKVKSIVKFEFPLIIALFLIIEILAPNLFNSPICVNLFSNIFS